MEKQIIVRLDEQKLKAVKKVLIDKGLTMQSWFVNQVQKLLNQ